MTIEKIEDVRIEKILELSPWQKSYGITILQIYRALQKETMKHWSVWQWTPYS